MKKLITSTLTFALALTLMFALAACSGNGNEPSANDTPQVQETAEPTPTEAPIETPETTTSDPTPDATLDDGSNLEIGNVNADNWAEVIQAYWSLDLSLPSDWSVASAQRPPNGTNIRVMFNVSGSVTAEQFGTTVFEESKEKSTRNLAKSDYFPDSFTQTSNNDDSYSWTYYHPLVDNGYSIGEDFVVINYTDNGTTAILILDWMY